MALSGTVAFRPDVEEVVTARYAILGHFVRKILHEVVILLHEWPEVYHTKLVIKGYFNPLHICLL